MRISTHNFGRRRVGAVSIWLVLEFESTLHQNMLPRRRLVAPCVDLLQTRYTRSSRKVILVIFAPSASYPETGMSRDAAAPVSCRCGSNIQRLQGAELVRPLSDHGRLLAQPYAWEVASRGYKTFAPRKFIDGLAWRVAHNKEIRYRLIASNTSSDQVVANRSGILPCMRNSWLNHPAITTPFYHEESRSQSTAHITPQSSKFPLSPCRHPGKAAKQTRVCSLPSRFRSAPLCASTVSSPRTTTCADCVGEFTTNGSLELESFSDSILALHDACSLKYVFPACWPRAVEVRETNTSCHLRPTYDMPRYGIFDSSSENRLSIAGLMQGPHFIHI
ncbi:hypothetical protein BKA63DRAFT_269443 [Paraphoma chrysanthemicola]|nr:hypothetical protein BKA63DRAFT_269443 [Paraphoma chrysanthemicola]